MRRSWILLAWLWLVIPALADDPIQPDILPAIEPQAGPVLTLQECLKLAYLHHPVLASSQQSVIQAQASLDATWALFYPSLSVTSSVTRQNFTAFQDGSSFPLNSVLAQLGVTQTILDSGQRYEQVVSAQEILRSSVLTFQNAWNNQAQLVQQAFCDLLQAELLLGTVKDNLSRTELNVNVASKFYIAGQKSKIDVTQAETQAAQAEVRLAQAQAQIRDLRLNLAQVLGVPVESIANRPLQNLLVEAPLQADRQTCLKQLDGNPQLTSLEAYSRANLALERLQWKNQLPTLSGSLGYGVQGTDIPQYRFWSAGVTLSVPFFNPATEPTARQYQALAQQNLKDRETAYLRLLQQLDTAFSDIQGARQRADRAARETRLAMENFKLAQRRYETSLSDITELINARGFIVSAQTDYVGALHDLKVAEGRLLQAIAGVPAPADDKVPDEWAPTEHTRPRGLPAPTIGEPQSAPGGPAAPATSPLPGATPTSGPKSPAGDAPQIPGGSSPTAPSSTSKGEAR